MPINSTFGQVVRATQDEARHFSSGAMNRNVLSQMKQTVRRVYRRLHGDFNWPHLYTRRDKAVGAGERYLTFPPDMDPDRTRMAWVTGPGTDRWTELEYGIGIDQYNQLNSDKFDYTDIEGTAQFGTTSLPSRWSRSPVTDKHFELWPVPVRPGTVVRFWGISRPRNLTNSNDLVDLDEDLVALYAASEWLADQKSPSASQKLEQAHGHYHRLKANSQNPGSPFRLNPASNHMRGAGRGITILTPR